MLRETYYSTTTNVDRFCNVLLPDTYTPEQQYPVVYVLHGIGGTEEEWPENGSLQEIMDELYKRNLVEPMILVFPNGRAMNPDTVPQDVYGEVSQSAFANFEHDLINDLIPYIEEKYSVFGDRDHRGICGLSMGGGQALNFGLSHPELFCCVGAFSPAPNTDTNKFMLEMKACVPKIWILCGESDELLYVSQDTHAFLSTHEIPHSWTTMSGGHDWTVWREGLRLFLQKSL